MKEIEYKDYEDSLIVFIVVYCTIDMSKLIGTWIPDSPNQLGSSVHRLNLLRSILPEIYKIILRNPLYAPINTGNQEQYQRFMEVYQREQEQFEKAWNFLAQCKLHDYIWFIAEFPKPLLTTIPSGSKEQELLQGLQGTYSGISIWLSCLAQSQSELSNSQLSYIEDFKPLGLLAQAILTLARDVYSHKQCSEELNHLFNSAEHLWFFCEVAICRRELMRVGLTTQPVILHQENIARQKQKSEKGLLSKEKLLDNWSKAIQQLEDPSEVKKSTSSFKDRVDLFEHLDWVLLNEAIRIADVDGNFYCVSWQKFTKTLHTVRNKVRKSKNLQAVYLYTFVNFLDEVHLHLTGKNRKMPKPPKKPKQRKN